jgi:hypothetical protein
MPAVPRFQHKPEVNKSLPEGRFAKSISIVLFLFEIEFAIVVNECLHTDELILENWKARFVSFWNCKSIFIVYG